MSIIRPIDSARFEVISSTKWLSCRMRLSSGNPRNLDTGDDLLGKAVVLGGPGRARGERKDALLVRRTLLEPNALGDRRPKDLVPEDIPDLPMNVPRQDGPSVVEGDHDPEELEPGVRTGTDLLVGLQQVVGPFKGEVGRL